MAKVIGFFSPAKPSSRTLSPIRRLLALLGTSARRPARLNPEEWSGHMLKDIGLSSHRPDEFPSRQQMIWMR